MKSKKSFLEKVNDHCKKFGNNYTIKDPIPKRPKPSAKPPLHVPIGWICPVCGSGLSLMTSRCPCVPLKMEITY